MRNILSDNQLLNKMFRTSIVNFFNFHSVYKYFFIFLFCFLSNTIYSQNYKEFETGFSTIFNYPFTLDSYHFGNNPAYLNFSLEDEFLALKTQTKNDEGDFKKFITPKINRSYALFASGKKSIDSTQKFKGSFGFSKIERKKWDWFFTRDYETDNPFLIGDSTSGDTRINGIILNTQYVINILNDFSAGVNLDYSVDEGLKTISPRPTSEHRDIHARLGIGYLINKDFSIGLTADVTDKNEQISYREDEGSLNQETIILKFKGYDFPNVLRKKVETRYAYTSGYASGITFSYNNSNNFSLAGYFNSGFEKNSIKDDALDPKGVGFWKDDYLEAGIKLTACISKDINTGLSYNYLKRNGWAKYPPTDVLYYERNYYLHSLIAGYEQKISEDICAGLEAGFSISSKKEDDHYSVVNSNLQFNQYFGKLGINYNWSENLSSLISYGFSKKASPNSELHFSNNSVYFTNGRIYDLLYLQSGFIKHNFSVTSEIKAWVSNAILFHLNYSLVKPQLSIPFGNANRKEFDLTLEYRVKVI